MSNINKINGFQITAQSASYAATASVVLGSITSASYSDTAVSASYALTASYAMNGGGSGVTINNNTNNYVVTATGTAATLDGEANLTFNGSTLAVTGNVTANSFTGSLQGTATTASYVLQAVSSSFATSSSLAVSASYAPDTTFPYTGSARITGSLGVTGSITLLPTISSTSAVFNIRNSADNKNIVEVRGDGETRYPGLTAVGNYVAIKNYTSYDANIDLMGGNSVKVQIYNDVDSNGAINRGLNLWNPGLVGSATAKINNIVKSGLQAYGAGYGFNWAFTSDASGIYTQAERAMWLTHQKSLVFYTGSISPTTDVHGEKGGSFEIFASSSTATDGVAAHFITNAGTVTWIGNQSRLFNVTASVVTATSFTGSLLGTASTASFVTTAQTASFINPLNQNVTVTGSATISQNLSIGTTLTTSPLTVISSASPLMTVQSTTANSYSNIRFSGSARSYTIGVGNDSETTFGVANDFFIYDDTTGAMRMAINTAGDIGVGTTSPADKFHVIGNVTASGNITAQSNLISANSVGDEGGEILLAKPQTNSTLTGSGVTIDVYQNRLRIFEQGGTTRGGYWDLTALASGAGTNLAAGSSATFNNNTNNYVMTGTGTANTLNGEANLTFDGSTLAVTGNVTATSFTGSLQGTASYADVSPVQSSTSGVGTSPTATQTDTVTHGLGRTPVKIRIYGASQFTSNASATPTPFSIGTWTSSGNRCIYQAYNTAAITTTQNAATSTTFAVRCDTGANSFVTGVIQNVGATTFEIAWTETGTAAAKVYMWECE